MSGMFPVASFPSICYRTEDYHCVSVSRLFGSPLSRSIFVYEWPRLSVALTDSSTELCMVILHFSRWLGGELAGVIVSMSWGVTLNMCANLCSGERWVLMYLLARKRTGFCRGWEGGSEASHSMA